MKDTNLITEAALAGVAARISGLTKQLQDHIAAHYSTVHPAWVQTGQKTTDSGGHVNGHNAIRVVVGGNSYLLPADTRMDGPAIWPRVRFTSFKNRCLDLNTYANDSEVTLSYTDERLTISSGRGEAHPQILLNGTLIAGTLPITYGWQYSINQVDWLDFTMGTAVHSISGYFLYTPVTSVKALVATPITGTLTTGTTLPKDLTFAFDAKRDYDNAHYTEKHALWIRLHADNSAIGGGEGNSDPLLIWHSDNATKEDGIGTIIDIATGGGGIIVPH